MAVITLETIVLSDEDWATLYRAYKVHPDGYTPSPKHDYLIGGPFPATSLSAPTIPLQPKTLYVDNVKRVLMRAESLGPDRLDMLKRGLIK